MTVVFNNVSELSSGRESWKIMVKVIRKWYQQSFSNSKLPLALELVLMDVTGNKIHATVKKTLMYKFEKSLVEGNVYSISGFILVENSGDYKTTRHPYKISFMFKTDVSIVNQHFVDVFPYTFISLADILSPDNDSDYLVDVIGILTGVGVEREILTHGKRSKMIVVEIESSGLSIECALFGAYVDELSNFLGGGDVNNPVIVVQFAKVKVFQGNISLQNVHGATKILFEPDLPMANVLKTSFLETSASASRSLSQLTDSKTVSGEDDFLVINCRKKISELKDIKKDCVCIVYATICPLDEGADWWYTACKCNRKVYADEKMYFCEGCNRHVLAVYPRYRLQITVEDDTGNATLVLFDKEASLLVGKSCTEMVDELEKNAASDVFPEEFNNFIGIAALFKIEVKYWANQRFERARFDTSYRVKRLCLDEAIIEQFKNLQLEHSVGASSSRMLLTPPSKTLHDGLSKDLLEEFVVVTEEKSPETPLCLSSPTVDLDGDTQKIINSKRSSSPEGDSVGNGNGRKKKSVPKAKKEKI